MLTLHIDMTTLDLQKSFMLIAYLGPLLNQDHDVVQDGEIQPKNKILTLIL